VPDGSWAFGYFTGSGLPMRFVDAEGRLIDNWQQNTHLVDEQVIAMPWGANFAGSTPEEAVEIASDASIRRAAGGAPTPRSCVQCHFDPFAVPGPWTAGAGRYLAGVLASGRAHGLPILAGAHAGSAFTQARAGVRNSRLYQAGRCGRRLLTFTIHRSARQMLGLTLLLPRPKYSAQRLVGIASQR
jgi:mono/diheme cytochrome c family protein